MLREGQVHAADGMTRFLNQTHQQALRIARHIDYRLDAGFTIGADLDQIKATLPEC